MIVIIILFYIIILFIIKWPSVNRKYQKIYMKLVNYIYIILRRDDVSL